MTLQRRKYLEELGINVRKPQWWLYQPNIDEVSFKDTDRIPKKRLAKFRTQRKRYGFDERNSWNLDDTMLLILYEQVRMYWDLVESYVDLTWIQIKINGKTKSQGRWIKTLLFKIELLVRNKENNHPKFAVPEFKDLKNGKTIFPQSELEHEIWQIWTEIVPAMWW